MLRGALRLRGSGDELEAPHRVRAYVVLRVPAAR